MAVSYTHLITCHRNSEGYRDGRDRGRHELSCYRGGRNTYGGVCLGVCKLLLICLSASCALAFLQKGAIFI